MAKVVDEVEAERALGILLGDEMMRGIARGGRFRVCSNQALTAPLPGRRLRGIDLVDYASDRAVTACVDLDRGGVEALRCAPAEARLAPAEEDEALEVALADRRVAAGIALGDQPQSIVHAGSGGHRAAAVTFGTPRCAPSLVAIVDLARRTVTRVGPADAW
jgi:hypothetical protein